MHRFDTEKSERDVVAQAISRSAVSLPDDRRRVIRARVMTHVTRDALLSRGRIVFRRAMATVTVAATMLGGVSYAAAVSLPGDPLYGIKRLSENVTLQVLPDGEMQRHFLFTIATRRADELARMTTDGADDALMLRTFEQFKAATSAAYGDGADVGEVTTSETRLRERVNAAPQPTKTQLQNALDAADSGAAVQPSNDVGPQSPGGESDTGEESSDPSSETTGPAGMGRN
ncbi:MAG: DUF5667 domain-containing protein [Coriobacteriia bacterium]|nr:DUF5667 domain-containing protein [Coriobacteriia bacterium]